jgi:hypothetical protein
MQKTPEKWDKDLDTNAEAKPPVITAHVVSKCNMPLMPSILVFPVFSGRGGIAKNA